MGISDNFMSHEGCKDGIVSLGLTRQQIDFPNKKIIF